MPPVEPWALVVLVLVSAPALVLAPPPVEVPVPSVVDANPVDEEPEVVEANDVPVVPAPVVEPSSPRGGGGLAVQAATTSSPPSDACAALRDGMHVTIAPRARRVRELARLPSWAALGYARRMGSGTREALRPLLWVFLAGGVGATLRVVIAGLIDARWADRLPYVGTLVVNMIGCFAIGVAAAALPPGTPRTAVVGGLLGGFTTYSAFALFSYELLDQGRLGALTAQLVLHLTIGIACAAGGMVLGRAVFGPPGS